MKKTNKLSLLAAGFATLSLVVAACGGSSSGETAAPAADAVSYPGIEDCADVSYDYTAPAAAGNGMKITYDIASAAGASDESLDELPPHAATTSDNAAKPAAR